MGSLTVPPDVRNETGIEYVTQLGAIRLASPIAHIRLRPSTERELEREAAARGVLFSELVRAVLDLHVRDVDGVYLGYRDAERVVMQVERAPVVEIELGRRAVFLTPARRRG